MTFIDILSLRIYDQVYVYDILKCHMRIFQSRDDNLVEIHEESFDLERTIQNLVEKNLDSIFSGLEFVESEFQIDDLRPDTIAFDSEKKSFVIIEYKKIENRSLIDQGVSYYQLLHERKENFVLLYNKKMNKTSDVNDINWDETRIIFISPEYTKYQKRASGFQGLPIDLYEIKKYQDNIITLVRIVDSQIQNLDSTKSYKPRITLSEYVEKDYLAGKYHNQYPTDETKKLWNELKEIIENTFEDIEFIQKKIYARYSQRDSGSSICTLEVLKNKIILNYSTSDMTLLETSEFVEDVSNVGHHGIGNFRSSIASSEDITKAIPIIQKVYLSKK
jgi:predicted transport protein